MKKNEVIDCPLCNSSDTKKIFDLNCGNFDDSTLYQTVIIMCCAGCGHVYNRLTSNEIDGLKHYYGEEYAPSNIGSTDTTGDRPGSTNHNTVERYNHLFDFISDYATDESAVLDIGCAMGGFLHYLHTKKYTQLSGIDPTAQYVGYAKQNTPFAIKQGCAESIPFSDKSFNLVVMDQVLEHSVEPLQAFREAKRVLVDGGFFCIGVPDASRYRSVYFFDYFWFLMREHVQHFDVEHLELLAAGEGFTLISQSRSQTPMMSDKMILPNLNVMFRLTKRETCRRAGKQSVIVDEFESGFSGVDYFKLAKEIELYAIEEHDRLSVKREIVDKLRKSGKPVYVWGTGREFLYLYEAAGLKHCNIAGLIDSNHYKQTTFRIDGHKIFESSKLKEAAPDSVVIIGAVAHTEKINERIKAIGCLSEVIQL